MDSKADLDRVAAMGKWRYVFVYGVLGWGVSTAALVVGWTWLTSDTLKLKAIISPFVTLPIAGIAWGSFMWSIAQKKHTPLQIASRSTMAHRGPLKG